MTGVISDRLRRIFAPGDPAWTPPRGTDPPRQPPEGASGQPLSGRSSK